MLPLGLSADCDGGAVVRFNADVPFDGHGTSLGPVNLMSLALLIISYLATGFGLRLELAGVLLQNPGRRAKAR